jgi:hypothetical protein
MEGRYTQPLVLLYRQPRQGSVCWLACRPDSQTARTGVECEAVTEEPEYVLLAELQGRKDP